MYLGEMWQCQGTGITEINDFLKFGNIDLSDNDILNIKRNGLGEYIYNDYINNYNKLLSGSFILDDVNNFILAEGLYNAYINYGAYSWFLQNEYINSLPDRIAEFFAYNGIATDGLSLPDINTVAGKITGIGDDVIKNTSFFLFGFDKLFEMADNWFVNELFEWKNGLMEVISGKNLDYAEYLDYRINKALEF